jgi:thioredoxin-dependent peroxiredoxin
MSFSEDNKMIISEKSKAPDFELMDETGKPRKLSDFHGKAVVLYFYPKDDTPGCTTEACSFRDGYIEYKEKDVTILGVSPDTVKSHQKFKEKYKLPFTLLADPDHKVCELYGVWGKKKMMGKEYDGVFRTTFVIGSDGNVKKVFENVKPADHAKEVLEAVFAA